MIPSKALLMPHSTWQPGWMRKPYQIISFGPDCQHRQGGEMEKDLATKPLLADNSAIASIRTEWDISRKGQE
jgi:hypothetical protein